MRPARAATLPVVALALAGCGSDFRPREFDPTGTPAAPLGQVVDLEISLPALIFPGTSGRGAEIEMLLLIEDAVPGRHPARYVFERARAAGRGAEIEDLSGGRTTVTISQKAWTTGRVGPLRIDGAVFEMLLDGSPEEGGWQVAGASWESQTGLHGTFRGWRRHRFLVAATDYFSSGRVAEVSLVKGRELRSRDGLTTVSADPVLRRSGRAVFAVNRLSYDDLQRLDPDRDFATAWQGGLGVGSNPQDALMLSEEKLYVTRYEPPFNDVAVADPAGGRVHSTIPLQGLAENGDGTPRPHALAEAAGAVFVGLQDIDRTFTVYGEGKLAVIDPQLDQVVGVVRLGGKNPGEMEVLRGEDGREVIYVALGGVFPGLLPQELSGGVVVVDPDHRVVERVALDDDAAGGNVAALALASARLGYVVVSDAEYVNRVVAFDPVEGEALRVVLETRDFVPEVEVDSRGVLAVPDRSFFAPRLCLYAVPADPRGEETPLGCAALALPPVSVEALD